MEDRKKKKRNQTEELKESLPKLWQLFFFFNSKRKESSSSGNGDEAREGMEEWRMKGWKDEERRIRAEQSFRALPGAAVD